jgi:hypothetical protein
MNQILCHTDLSLAIAIAPQPDKLPALTFLFELKMNSATSGTFYR